MTRWMPFCAAVMAAATTLAQKAVLYTGSDWNDAEKPLCDVWASPGFAKVAGVALDVVDAPEVVTEAVKERWEAQKALRLGPANIPAFAWFDAKGRCVFKKEGLIAKDAAAAQAMLAALVAEGKTAEQRVAALLAEDTAEAAGKLLAEMVPMLGLGRTREAAQFKAAWDVLKAKDPEDKTGWAFALTFDPVAHDCYTVQGFKNKGDLAGAEAYIKGLEAKPQTHLSANQKQGLKMLRYILYRHDNAKKAEMDALLREVLAMGADTHFGLGAQGELCLRGEGPVAIPYGWFPKHVAAKGEQTWEIAVGAKKHLREAGWYRLTLKRENGSQGTMRLLAVNNEVFTAEQQEIAPNGMAQTTFHWDAKGEPKLTLKVAFDAPGPQERGTIAVAPTLPPRGASSAASTPAPHPVWAHRIGEPVVMAYARTVLPETLLKEMDRDGERSAFLAAFFKDKEWMEAFFGSGDPSKDWEAAFKALSEIVYGRLNQFNAPALRRWAAAAALNAGDDPIENIRLLDFTLEQRANRQLVRGADELRCDQMRFTQLPQQCNADSARWLATRHNVPPHAYEGTCWHAPYRGENFFGDSVQGPEYYPAWDHAYIRHENTIKVGGVCGALSYYGSATAKTRGVPSTPGGQPGHCAYHVWSKSQGRWIIGNNISPYSWLHFSLWRDCNRFAYLDLAADSFGRAGMKDSMRRLWMAEVALANRPREGDAFDEAQVRRYRFAAEPCPNNYALWRAYSAYLRRCKDTPLAAWEAFVAEASRGLNGHLSPLWDLLTKEALPALQSKGGEAAVKKALLALNATLRQGDWSTFEFCDYTEILNAQAKLLHDAPEACFALFAAALPTQWGTPDALGQLMRWGGSRFLKNATLAPRYIAALEGQLKARGNEGNSLGRYVRETIREASKAQNLEAFRSLCALQEALAPYNGRTPLDLSFAKGAPLLSDRALLRLSTSGGYDNPDAYPYELDALSSERFFHTDHETSPWAEVQLSGMAEVSAVYIANRPGQEGRLVPFVLEVSEDGKTWREVAKETEVRSDYRFTFTPVQAGYVRLRCTPSDKTYLHLRKFCVFGKKLY